jgi:Outer membrane protein beta-barrel domain
MKLKFLSILALSAACTFTLSAQIKGGVRIGLNLSDARGPLEMDAAGVNLESRDQYVGFHIGPSFSYSFTDNFGIRADLMYSRRGYKYKYTGPERRSYTYNNSSTVRNANGNVQYALTVNNTYFDVPLVGYARLGRFEFSGGIYASLLFQSVGEGSASFNWGNAYSPTTTDFILNYNYRRDDPGESPDPTTTTAIRVGSEEFTVPTSLGAYYNQPDAQGNLFKGVDYGVIGGLAFYVRSSLYFGARLQYGLADLTRTEADFGISNSDATTGALQQRDDNDRTFNLQLSVGFSF